MASRILLKVLGFVSALRPAAGETGNPNAVALFGLLERNEVVRLHETSVVEAAELGRTSRRRRSRQAVQPLCSRGRRDRIAPTAVLDS